METTIPLLVIEGNRLLRDGIAAALSVQPGFRVVAAAPDGETALRQVRETKPQVVLLDASSGNPDTMGLVASIREACPAQVIVMTFLRAQEDVVAYMKLGVSGFVSKDATIEDLVRTIRSVTAGTHVLPPSMVETLFRQLAEQAAREKKARLTAVDRLTRREREIIGMVQEGLSNKEVAQRLRIATHTVKSHMHNILKKLALRTRLQLAAYATRHQARRGVERRAVSRN